MLTVASPGERFVTGGGSVPDGEFSFNVKDGKDGLKGSSVYAYRTRMDGHDVLVTISSSDLTALSTGIATTFPLAAFVTGAADVQVVDAVTGQRYASLEPEGVRFRLDLTDKANGGKTDTYGFTAYRSEGTPFHQANVGALPQDGTGSPSNQVKLSSGNVTVHAK